MPKAAPLAAAIPSQARLDTMVQSLGGFGSVYALKITAYRSVSGTDRGTLNECRGLVAEYRTDDAYN